MAEQTTETASRRLWIPLVGLILAVLGLVPAYFIFWDKPELVYQTEVVSIPLPENMSVEVPDHLLLVTVRNDGRRPSENVEGSIVVNGELLQYEVRGPNPAYGQVTHRRGDSSISFQCPRLAHGDFPIKFSVWYKASNQKPEVGVADSTGAANELSGAPTKTMRWFDFLAGVFGLAYIR